MKGYQEEALRLYDTLPELKWDKTRTVETSVIKEYKRIKEVKSSSYDTNFTFNMALYTCTYMTHAIGFFIYNCNFTSA